VTTIIVSGSLSFIPTLITSWRASQVSSNVLHPIIGRTFPDVTLKPAQARTGTLEMFFASGPAAESARTILSSGSVFVISSDETPWLDGLAFVLAGSIASSLSDASRLSWMLSADFQEVLR
jgi:hypothetical protein